jgi:hypothetical protein
MAKLYWLSDTEWAQSRRIEAAVRGVLVDCIYLPNGNPQQARNSTTSWPDSTA